MPVLVTDDVLVQAKLWYYGSVLTQSSGIAADDVPVLRRAVYQLADYDPATSTVHAAVLVTPLTGTAGLVRTRFVVNGTKVPNSAARL
jgi:hypothetical protein